MLPATLQGRIWHKIQLCRYKKSVFVSGGGNGFCARTFGLKSIGANVPFVATLLTHFTKVVCGGMLKTLFVRPSSSILISPPKTSQRMGSVNRIASNSSGISDPLDKVDEFRSKYMSKHSARRLPDGSKTRDLVTLSEFTSISFHLQIAAAKSSERPSTRNTGFSFPSFGNLTLLQRLAIGKEGRFSKPSIRSSGFTNIFACPSKAKIGWFIQSAICCAFLISCAVTNASPISHAIPAIKSSHPTVDNQCKGLKNGGEYFSFFISATFSSKSPANTAIPPIPAQNKTVPFDNANNTEGVGLMQFLFAVLSVAVPLWLIAVAVIIWGRRH